jgi:plasmid stability protein
MASVITIRNLDESVQRVLRHRAVDHGVSFEAELRSVLEQAARAPANREPTGLAVLLTAAAQFRDVTKGLDFTVTRVQEYPSDSLFEDPSFK